jgi:hypothetical protein
LLRLPGHFISGDAADTPASDEAACTVPTIYAKSPAGQLELKSRSNAVPPRARTLLILVDGKRSDTELSALVPDFEASVGALLKAGLIEPVASARPPASTRAVGGPEAPSPAPAPAPAAAAAAERVPPPPPAPAAIDLPTLRLESARAVNNLLGPEGDALAMRIERAAEAEVLQVALERCVSYIAATRGKRAADEFAQRYLAPLAG